MNSPITPKPTRSANTSGQAAMPPASGYAPSVPISVYREVVAELQATKTTMDTLKKQNQLLALQNQQLRQEIEKTVQSALHLRQTANEMSAINPDAPSTMPVRLDLEPEPEPKFQIPVMPSRSSISTKRSGDGNAESKLQNPSFSMQDLVIEEDSKPRRKLQLEKQSASELSGWWLTTVVALIIVTAFGAGFLIVRPLLPSSK
jgi:cobalamin biosynthesis Mg chelatase CobN